MPRIIHLELTDEFMDQHADTPRANLDAAIGHLCGWSHNAESKQRLRLYGDKRGDLNATYRNDEGTVTYQILGQHDGKGNFTFHS